MTSRIIAVIGVLGALAAPLHAQKAPQPLPVASLAGQQVAVLPLTLLAADPAVKTDSLYVKYQDHTAAVARADSTIAAALTERCPEVKWVLPPELRKLARRSPGLVKNPDELGQAILRSSRYREVPEPLRADLRNLMAVANGRIALVPAALSFRREADGHNIRADLSLVLVDARSSKVLWRTLVSGSGGTPDLALETALAAALPLNLSP